MPVIAVERSGDAKLSRNMNVSATWVPQQSCHDDCPLKRNGCYAETGNSGLHSHRLNMAAGRLKMGLRKLRLKLAKEEAAAIRGLSGLRQLRVHVVGDCSDTATAGIIGRAMVAHQKRHGKAAWTYSHSWRRIARSAWQGANVLASCEKPEQVREARQRGYAAALIVPPHPSNKVYAFHGVTIVPCPAQFKKDGKFAVTCEDCTLCKRPDFLFKRKLTIGFQPDAGSQRKVLAVIQP
jgi:hypothetical protein